MTAALKSDSLHEQQYPEVVVGMEDAAEVAPPSPLKELHVRRDDGAAPHLQHTFAADSADEAGEAVAWGEGNVEGIVGVDQDPEKKMSLLQKRQLSPSSPSPHLSGRWLKRADRMQIMVTK